MSTVPITTPLDAELVMITYCRAIIDPLGIDIDVHGGASQGGRFVRVRRIGGVEVTPHHDGPVFDVICWHDNDAARMQLALQLWTHIRSAAGVVVSGGVLMYDSTTLGVRQMPDPADSTKSVCMFTVQMIVSPTDAAVVVEPADTRYGFGVYGDGPYGGTQ